MWGSLVPKAAFVIPLFFYMNTIIFQKGYNFWLGQIPKSSTLSKI